MFIVTVSVDTFKAINHIYSTQTLNHAVYKSSCHILYNAIKCYTINRKR